MSQPCSVMLSVARTTLLLAVGLAIATPRVALQSVAWGAMIVKYSQQANLAKAIAQTFDGEHPCDLCKHLSKAQQPEKKQDAQAQPLKPDLICATRTLPLIVAQTEFHFPSLRMAAIARVELPPTPPPRFELA